MTFVPTPQQQHIISYPMHHLRVAAGAGTGKTTTMVERLGAFVETGTKPTRALGITFTVKASDELRNRLRDRLGTDSNGEEVEVSTYHGFAASILDEFGALVGYDQAALLLDDGHRTELGQQVLTTTPTNLDLTAMAARVGDVLDLNDGLDRHLASPVDLAAIAPKTGPDDLLDTWATRLDLAAVVETYRSEKQRLGLIEFSDLIAKAVQLVRDHPEIATELAGRYDIVLLDEYQDTDPAQRILLAGIFGRGAAVTAVGDSDQTIYEWRGASLDNFDAFPTHFPRIDGLPTETLPLSLNRRSDRIIIDLANAIKTKLPSIDGSQPLIPQDNASEGTLMAAWFRSEREEAWWIAEDILRRHEDGVLFADIAILVRKRAWIPLLVAALREFDVPTSVSDPGTLLRVPEVADVVAWLRVVADPDAEPAILRILMGGQYRLGIADLQRLKQHADALGSESIMGSIVDTEPVPGLAEPTAGSLERFRTIHERLLRFGQANTVAATINEIMATIGFWDEAAALRPGEATTARLNISRFLNLANGWRPIEGRPTVRRFLRYVDALDESGRDEALTPPTRSVADAVELTTIHGAKGLEWGTVYLPGLVADSFPMSARRHDDPDRHAMLVPYELRLDAENLTDLTSTSGTDRKDALTERNLESEHRLAYVAVTRAKHRLTMSGHVWQDHLKRSKKPSPYLLMAKELPGVTLGPWVEHDGEPPSVVPFNEATAPPDPLFVDGVAQALRKAIADPMTIRHDRPEIGEAAERRVAQLELEIADLGEPASEPVAKPFATAVTNLVTLAQCPLRFKWIHYDKLPRRPSNAAMKGTEFHRRVELHNLGVISLDDAAPDAYDAVEIDEAVADTTPHRPTSDPWTVFEASRFADMRARFTEAPFEFAAATGSVRGKIDAIYESQPGVWEIVDYKSGRPSTDPTRLVQLKAYAVAVAEGAVSSEVPDAMSVSFAYFGAESVVEITADVDEAWLNEARRDIDRLVVLGSEGPWDPTPSDACRTCDFRIHCDAGKEWIRGRPAES